VAGPQAPKIEQEAFNNSGIKLIYLKVFIETPAPLEIPNNS